MWIDLITEKSKNSLEEWCLGGDFNYVIEKDERLGSVDNGRASEMDEFRGCIDNMKLTDMPCIDGSVTEDFKVEKGLQQGDSLSSFLFVMVMEGLTSLMDSAVELGEYNCFMINKDASIDILQFSNDTTIIGDGSSDNLWSIKAPPKVLKEIRSILSKFLWQGIEDKRPIHLVRWEQVCKSKDYGGVGIINLEVYNKALLMKWKWRIVNDSGAIWRGLIKHRYKNSEVNMFISDVCALNRGGSIWWRDLILIDSLEDGKRNYSFVNTLYGVKDDVNTSFWFSKWVGNEPLKDVFPEFFFLATDPPCSVADVGQRVDNVWK
ncbi:hypothetical protein KIW84_051277 [Lathyrus oleraceus]|uniref:Non-LTR retroelement reverse transcriptase n=1 Tax=Pisum sativum TaxID=3888 RepID=A0A9D4WMA6_PEA|nr:hypothetical protein KIW84_051277 [Pisum sativum]